MTIKLGYRAGEFIFGVSTEIHIRSVLLSDDNYVFNFFSCSGYSLESTC